MGGWVNVRGLRRGLGGTLRGGRLGGGGTLVGEGYVGWGGVRWWVGGGVGCWIR